MTKPRCVVDRHVLNADTVNDLTDMLGSIFGPLCGRNRGAFVLDPPTGHTYGCTDFPRQFASDAGVNRTIGDSNAVKSNFVAGNITAAQTVDIMESFLSAVYHSTPNLDSDPYACEMSGLAQLACDKSPARLLNGTTIRSVTTAGLFVEADWATGGHRLSLAEARHFYRQSDFDDMSEYGLNAVLIPVPLAAFSANDDSGIQSLLQDVMAMADKARIATIIALVDSQSSEATGNEAIRQAAAFAAHHGALALQLPSLASAAIEAARAGAHDLALFVPVNLGQLKDLSFPDDNMYAAIDFGHTSTVADVASDTDVGDRMKLFYHEAIACIARSPIEYTQCYRSTGVFVSSGFDLANDDCAQRNHSNYGQCGRFDATRDSPWWQRHRQSLAERQLYAFERGMGWNYAAWKLYGDETGLLDSPAKLLSFRDVAAAGLFPSLQHKHTAGLACLNPPTPDFILGDDTVAPSPGPPPDCGDGWWNYDMKACEFWVPPVTEPPETPAPTPQATLAPTRACPACPACPTPVVDFVASGALGALLGAGLVWLLGRHRRAGYDSIPN